MGGFFLDFTKAKKPDVSSFVKRGQEESFCHSEDNFVIKKFKKFLLDHDYFIWKESGVHILACGTISYKSLPLESGFAALCQDIKKGKLESNELFGHFTIIVLRKEAIKIYFDRSGYGAPFVVDNRFVSSSFLCLADNLKELSLNNEAVFEQIYTGCYFGEKTTFNEIRLIKNTEKWKIGDLKIEFVAISPENKPFVYKNSNNALKETLHQLEEYFNRWKPQVSKYIADLGLSSGYDSRLMLCYFEKVFKNSYQIHSYWKKKKDFDIQIAELLASEVNKELKLVPLRDRKKMSAEDFEDLLNNAMNYYDGLFPVNHGWVREYRTSNYRKKILGKAKFGFSGLSGEQYRNDFNLLNKSFTYNYLIENLILEDDNYIALKKSNFSNEGIRIIEESINSSLGIQKKSKRISRYDIQRYYCEMWVPGGPGLRNRIENNISFFISPFTENDLQNKAYGLLKYLGFGGTFQAEMINELNSKIAKIISDYGFSFNNIKMKNKFLWFISALLGRNNKIRLISIFKPTKFDYFANYGTLDAMIKKKIEYLQEFNFKFPVVSNHFNENTMDRLVALSTLLKKYEEKIDR